MTKRLDSRPSPPRPHPEGAFVLQERGKKRIAVLKRGGSTSPVRRAALALAPIKGL